MKPSGAYIVGIWKSLKEKLGKENKETFKPEW